MNNKEISKCIEIYHNEMIETLKEFVSINTIYDEKSVDMINPFGKGVTNGLEFIYNLAKKDGFEVTNYNNYCVEITYGEGEIVDILAHCDVVTVSENWSFNPFSKLSDDKYIYGRGTQDDKGPLLASYYALKALKDNKIKINKKIRFIVGGNEESGSACLNYYYKILNKEYPKYGFTPDAEFPLINGEKGITRLEVRYDNIDSEITSIRGGKAINIVMDEIEFIIRGKSKKYYGKAAHASKPQLGDNAFIEAIKDLKDNYPEFKKIYDDFNDYNGKGLGIDSYDGKLKELTMNIGKVELRNNSIYLTLDIRYPTSTNIDKIKEQIQNKGYSCKVLMNEDPIYTSEDSFLVKTLLNSYDSFLNTKSKPFTIGGGTYAKSSKNVVAFGMLFEDDNDYMHQDDEKIRIDHYLLGAKIYLKAIIELTK